jgi:hypothetical protein
MRLTVCTAKHKEEHEMKLVLLPVAQRVISNSNKKVSSILYHDITRVPRIDAFWSEGVIIIRSVVPEDIVLTDGHKLGWR